MCAEIAKLALENERIHALRDENIQLQSARAELLAEARRHSC